MKRQRCPRCDADHHRGISISCKHCAVCGGPARAKLKYTFCADHENAGEDECVYRPLTKRPLGSVEPSPLAVPVVHPASASESRKRPREIEAHVVDAGCAGAATNCCEGKIAAWLLEAETLPHMDRELALLRQREQWMQSGVPPASGSGAPQCCHAAIGVLFSLTDRELRSLTANSTLANLILVAGAQVFGTNERVTRREGKCTTATCVYLCVCVCVCACV